MEIRPERESPLIIGHRGASRDAPENTLESFRLAWQQGADGIEADFRLTADGRIVCIHDDTTLRTTGTALTVSDTSLSELRLLDAGSWKGLPWSGALIPTLDEVLMALPERSWFFMEIKCGEEIIAPLTRLLRVLAPPRERIRLLSFSAELIARLKQQLPEWRACWLCDYRSFRPDSIHQTVLETLDRSGADGLASANTPLLDPELIRSIRKREKELHIWTVDRSADARRLSSSGVDSIMTNRPGWLREALTREPRRGASP